MNQVASPRRDPRLTRLRLFVSYQRYAFLMAGAPTAITAAVIVGWPAAWWLWAPAALITLRLYGTAWSIAGRWPRKLRATWLAQRRIEAGRFRPDMVARYCGDPCFRVVAREILIRADVPRRERAALLRRYAAEEAERGHTLLLVDRQDGVLFEIDGGNIRRHDLARDVRAAHATGDLR